MINQHTHDNSAPKLTRSEETEFRPAGFWIRLAATFFDGMFMGILLLPFNLAMQYSLHEEQLVLMGISYFLYYGLFFGITAWFMSRKGGLPGKLLLGLKVVDTKTGFFVSPWKALGRELFGKFLCYMTFTIGFIMIAFNKEKKGLHDYLAGTMVLQKVKKK
ncbi:MAG TPA: RDD family protein [Oligoflexia bacterium]|nr:RDD family protein [Oligoflexia bacterium]HMP47112.1 RDD family protein [Oligoflexia bacterium]